MSHCTCGVLKSRNDGWTLDPVTHRWVCSRCRLPSRMVVERLRHAWAELERVERALLR